MKIKFILLSMCLLFNFKAFTQKVASFSSLGNAEKVWVLLHPFSANKAYKISKEVEDLCNSMKEQKILDADAAGGKLDAFRHAYWMALLAKHIGPVKTRWLGKAHEKKNRKDFEKRRLEEGVIPDEVSMKMDLFNNDVGIQIGSNYSKLKDEDLKTLVLQYIKEGKMLVIKKDEKLNSLSGSGKIIPREEWEGKWENERVLVPSNAVL